jgi:hypothetical protein
MNGPNLHPPLPMHGQAQSRPMLAAARAELGVDVTKLRPGRHQFSCRHCRQQRRVAPVLVVVDHISTTWSCRGCGSVGGFSCTPSQPRADRVAP